MLHGTIPERAGSSTQAGCTCGTPRVIPAGAGSRNWNCCRGCCGWGHPRACEEQSCGFGGSRIHLGTFLRVRGAACGHAPVALPVGNIPARAGNRPRPRTSRRRGRDHPRACGEQSAATTATERAPGPFPRRAGTRTGVTPPGDPGWDHPRACGEQHVAGSSARMVAGPSPHLWGAAVLEVRRRRRLGTLPVRAGSSRRWPTSLHRRRGHPRACGEQVYGMFGYFWQKEPSPRLRGAVAFEPSPHARGAACRRILRQDLLGAIPARAGNRLRPLSTRSTCWEHSRARGASRAVVPQQVRAGAIPARAQSWAVGALRRRSGPSPYARGADFLTRIVTRRPYGLPVAPGVARTARRDGGPIPARAGSSVLRAGG